MNSDSYQIGATKQFIRDLKAHVQNASVRSHINSFIVAASDPFARANQPEKLFYERRVGERYSLRLNDDFRIIFDKPTSNQIIYRALGKHDPTYRRGERLGAINWEDSQSFPMSFERTIQKRNISVQDRHKPPVQNRRSFEANDVPVAEKTVVEVVSFTESTAPVQLFQELSDSVAAVSAEPCVLFERHSDVHKAMIGLLDEWMLFLPEQHQQLVTQKVNGPARIFGASGTGKTCILLHRAAFLARESCDDVLVLTYKSTLVGFLSGLVDRLCADDAETRHKICVASVGDYAAEIAKPKSRIVAEAQYALIVDARRLAGREPSTLRRKFRRGQSVDDFVVHEITHWVKGAASGDREDYETFTFPPSKSALASEEVDWLFTVFSHYERLKGVRADDQDVLLSARRRVLETNDLRRSAVLVDEFQDLDLCALQFVRILCRVPEHLFFAGDHRQRIYQTLPSFERAQINIRGRSREVSLNYRNSPEIYAAAAAVLNGPGDDPDGEDRNQGQIEFAQSSSEKPTLRSFESVDEEADWVRGQILSLIARGTPEHHIAVISLNIQQSDELDWNGGFRMVKLDPERVSRMTAFVKSHVKRMTIHQAKGFEFPIVFMIGLTQESFDNSEMVRFQNHEEEVTRALLYVGMTRARDKLFMSTPGKVSRHLANVRRELFS